MSKPLILCVAQDDALGADVKRALNGSAFRLQFCQTPAGALAAVDAQPVAAFLVDHALAPDPAALIRVLREAAPEAAMLALCGAEAAARVLEPLGAGDLGGVLVQPLAPDAALRAVYRAVAVAVLDRLSRLVPETADRLLAATGREAVMGILRAALVDGELAPCASVSADLRVSASPWQKELFRDDDLRYRLDALTVPLLRIAAAVLARGAAADEGQSEYDALSGVFNRRGLQKALEREIERCERYGSSLAVLVLDVDGFSALNARHGRQAGDRVLKGLGNVLDGLTRRTDVIARLDNDEFCLLLPGLGAPEAVQAGRRFQREIATWSAAALSGAPVSLSLGVSSYAPGEKDAGLIIGSALTALESARGRGPGSIAWLDAEGNASLA